MYVSKGVRFAAKFAAKIREIMSSAHAQTLLVL